MRRIVLCAKSFSDRDYVSALTVSEEMRPTNKTPGVTLMSFQAALRLGSNELARSLARDLLDANIYGSSPV